MQKGVAAITGASSGLGAVFARKLAARGQDLLLAARRADRLEALREELEQGHGVRVETFACDLALDADVERLAARLEGEDRLELLVNNAGFGTRGCFWETDYSRQLEMVRVHILATMRLSRAALSGMVHRGHGGVINVSSVAAYFRSAGNASYCATKGWMNDFTEALRLELDSTGSPVVVQALCPGFTYTEFHDVMKVDRGQVPKWLWMPADFVVEESLQGLEKGKLFVIPSWKYRLGAAFAEWMPVRWRLGVERASPHKRGR
jgi:hypothetical protein